MRKYPHYDTTKRPILPGLRRLYQMHHAHPLLQGRVGRGGLGEAAAGGDEDGAHALLLGAGRRDEAVARTGGWVGG